MGRNALETIEARNELFSFHRAELRRRAGTHARASLAGRLVDIFRDRDRHTAGHCDRPSSDFHQTGPDLTLHDLSPVGWSTFFAILLGIPLGIAIARHPSSSKPVLTVANIIQTIPSLALFGFLLPVPWLGDRADRLAILALTLYALLPVIPNTYTGIRGVDPAVVEAGRGMGLTDSQLLFQVQLPLALGVILSGVRVAIVISVGLATIAAAIGAGGLGEFIFRGLAMVNNQLILAGAIPAAMLALLADFSVGWLERRLQPR